VDRPVVLADDVIATEQAHRCLHTIALGNEAGVEQSGELLGRDTPAGISDFDEDTSIIRES